MKTRRSPTWVRFRVTVYDQGPGTMLGEILGLVRDTLRWCRIPLRRRRIVYVPGQRDVVWDIVARRGDLEFLRDELAAEFGDEAGRLQAAGFVPPTVEDLGAAPVTWNAKARRWEPAWWL
jgi:hypothetical protein